jgi:GT2 family glycosyltransferase
VTAIVVTHSAGAEQLAACLRSLASSVGVNLHIVLVDNGSASDGAVPRDVVRHLAPDTDITLVHTGTNRGFAAGVNAGLARAPDGMVWLLNDDATVAPTTIRRCVDALDAASDTTIAIAPVVLLDLGTTTDDGPLIDSAGLVLRHNGEAFGAGLGQPDLGQYRSGDECFGPCFVAGLFRTGAFTGRDGAVPLVGPLDERYFMYYEDVDWAARAALSGYRVELLADSGVFHGHARSSRRLGEARRYGYVQRNLLVFAALNLSVRRATSIWAARIVVHSKGLMTGPFRVARLLSVAGALVRLPVIVAARRGRRSRFVLPESVLFRFAEDDAPFLEPASFTVEDAEGALAAARRRLDRRTSADDQTGNGSTSR